jgi:hypothetical protein
MEKSRKLKISQVTVLTAFIFGVSIWILYDLVVFQTPSLEIPDAKWVEPFFKDIDKATDLAILPKLREKRSAKDDLEIRVWKGFGLGELEGMFFQRIDNQWTATHLVTVGYSNPTEAKVQAPLRPPKSGWESFSAKIIDAGVLQLPDVEKTECIKFFGQQFDSSFFVVEFISEWRYRTYLYQWRPFEDNCEEGRKLNKIARVIATEFYDGIDKCRNAEWLPCLSRGENK